MLVAFVAAIVIFNSSFPFALNIVLALVGALGLWELITALGIQPHYVGARRLGAGEVKIQ